MKERLSDKKVLAFCVVLILVVILLAAAIFGSSSSGGGSQNGNSPSREATKPQIPMSEWGFNNSDDWGNKLVQVVGNPDDSMDQSFKDFNDEYVIISEGSSFWDFYPDTNLFAQGSFYWNKDKQTSMSSSYTVVSNDMISAPELGGSFEIKERIVVGDIVIFRRNWEYYIPYEMLDFNRVEFYREDGRYDYYKVYIK